MREWKSDVTREVIFCVALWGWASPQEIGHSRNHQTWAMMVHWKIHQLRSWADFFDAIPKWDQLWNQVHLVFTEDELGILTEKFAEKWSEFRPLGMRLLFQHKVAGRGRRPCLGEKEPFRFIRNPGSCLPGTVFFIYLLFFQFLLSFFPWLFWLLKNASCNMWLQMRCLISQPTWCETRPWADSFFDHSTVSIHWPGQRWWQGQQRSELPDFQGPTKIRISFQESTKL